MSKKYVFQDINSTNKLEISVNKQFHALFLKIKVPKKLEDEHFSSNWVSISYEDIDALVESLQSIKQKIDMQIENE
ncbi:hypothetical protein [Weeksella virosa]|uniref:Uncharacterized protein n=1 Tax=Weeksella virosa (strain ATCC 43766 / DSM 16922 / JCM 21250 / CCUG 30538 / CDC 9751 / IAM 14551 / NBRC 16016 / NCTC 11634 / CL345/78) TaxID=865938 RepID=F0P2S8_WEEVC|nr:hypothetical protein [Weeksella virosa]ADX66818.1 hypothetical protein Weevi_0092 [Weeksella virosa DSM 16922]MDK7675122.1 hypothetical protein [Weeksella virosa]VEH63458.1 Uncharacterised protein [Weeksella virosa]